MAPRPPREEKVYTPLNISYEKFIEKVKDRDILRKPRPIDPARVSAKDAGKYCKFHDGYGHTIDECYNLREQIEYEIKKGTLDEFVKGKPKQAVAAVVNRVHMAALFARIDRKSVV